jgi:hypothetical protein
VLFLRQEQLDGTQVKVINEREMSSLVRDFFEELFQAPQPEVEATPSWIFVGWSPSDLEGLPRLDSFLVREAANCLLKGKYCAEDRLVAEILQELDDDILSFLADTFKERLLNTSATSWDKAWDEHLVRLQRKKGFANRPFRPIASIPVLLKLYSHVLLLLSEGRLQSLTGPQYALSKGYQTHGVVFILRNLIEKAIEWNIRVFILDGDITKAYDYTLGKIAQSSHISMAKGRASWSLVCRFGSTYCIRPGEADTVAITG